MPAARHRSSAPAIVAFVALGVLAVAVAGVAAAAEGGKTAVYKWVDEKGVTHYGDAVPPQYSDQDRQVLNSQGVPVGTIPGRRTPEQLAAEAKLRTDAERARQQTLLARQRDQNLLATYLTVEEIEALRDRRVEILDAQARVVVQYLEQVRTQLGQLETQVQRFRPYKADGPRMPEHLAADLVRAAGDIQAQERNLEHKRQETAKLKEQFARDIARFRELKRIEAEYARSAQPRP